MQTFKHWILILKVYNSDYSKHWVLWYLWYSKLFFKIHLKMILWDFNTLETREITFSTSQYCSEAKKEKKIRRIRTISAKIQRDTPCFSKIESFSSLIVVKFPECISICRVRLIFLDHRKSGKLRSLP